MAYNTYARTVLSDQKRLVSLIAKYADPKAAIVKELDKDITDLPVITSEALKNALSHPHAEFIHFTIQTFAEYLRVIRHIYQLKQMLEDEIEKIDTSTQDFHRELGELDGDAFNELSAIVSQLEAQYVTLRQEEEGLEKNLDQLSGVISEITEIITRQDHEWDTYRENYNQQLVDLFDSSNFPISEIERNELLSQDSWESMLNRVKDLKIELPESMDILHPSFGTYFQLKAYLAMHSSLSRRMLPNSPEEVAQL